jgi:hypothetical protein
MEITPKEEAALLILDMYTVDNEIKRSTAIKCAMITLHAKWINVNGYTLERYNEVGEELKIELKEWE